MSNDRTEPIELTVTGLINDLHSGITRCKGDVGYDEQRGSVQEKYGLTKSEVKEIFKHEKLAGLKIRVPETPKYVLIDDTETANENTEETSEEPTPTESKRRYGQPSASAEKRMEEATSEEESITTTIPAAEVAESDVVDF